MRWVPERPGIFLLALVLLQACSDGYPREDAPLPSPFDMDSAQRITALNEIGAKAHMEQRRRFELQGDCGLQVTTKRPKTRELRETFELQRSMDVRVAFDKAGQTFDVHLVSRAEQPEVRLGILLKSTRWTDATRAHLLLQLLARDCGRA
ncbi:hypothetical protein SNE35_21645 [Paucibacter sp. R3-3]|uniref:DUF4426 domain-containing protein n=1 Tax=Roseateles agri TaxID=3098619 RepID=A0ABU5DLG2_9BURK|nr:hypothetical protein [Paucibacter sp. R3-3]MDY0747126.1 hypothetical protein [Paucibacter sp. R3-3]